MKILWSKWNYSFVKWSPQKTRLANFQVVVLHTVREVWKFQQNLQYFWSLLNNFQLEPSISCHSGLVFGFVCRCNRQSIYCTGHGHMPVLWTSRLNLFRNANNQGRKYHTATATPITIRSTELCDCVGV